MINKSKRRISVEESTFGKAGRFVKPIATKIPPAVPWSRPKSTNRITTKNPLHYNCTAAVRRVHFSNQTPGPEKNWEELKKARLLGNLRSRKKCHRTAF